MNSDWLPYLQDQLHNHGLALDAPATAPGERGFVAPLAHLGHVQASGEEAARFLHNQLTNDIEHLGRTEARLAAYCSAKGRMLASLLALRSGDDILLQVPLDVLPGLQKRLQMFVLRAKVKLADVSSQRVALGIAGATGAQRLGTLAQLALPERPWELCAGEAGMLLRVPDAFGLPRYQFITDAQRAMTLLPALLEAAPLAAPASWRLADIKAGLPAITAATQEQFVPQMINFELLGGVNFRKGCYPGQEVVARSQYLGKLKRRMYLAEVAATASAGDELVSEHDPSQPGGMVVNAESLGDGRSLALVELKSALLEQGSALRLGSAQGPQLTMQALPYSLPDPA